VSLGFPRRAQAGVAVGLALTFLVVASSPALADRVRTQEWWLRALHVTRAWRSTQGAGVTVALLDTGVDPKQADLTSSVVTGPDYTNSGRTPGGAFWGVHGTAMASIIAGHGHGAKNAAGIMGIAPAAKILSVRVTLEGNDPLLSNATIAAGLPNAIARGIRYAVRHHADVIDLPLDPVTTPGAAGSGGSPAERAAVAYANARHVVLVAPAGDGGAAGSDAVNYPAAYPGVISVGAFNEKFIKAPYSSHRSYVTLTAAGDGMTAANGPKQYAQVHSTSAASAVVAGTVALIKAQFPRLSSARVRQVLATSTVYRPKGGKNDGSGYGTVDAAAALMAASKMVEAVPAAATGASGAAQAPPSAPAGHSTVISKNLGHNLITDAAIAVVVFVVLLGAILGFRSWRRRQARSARLAEVRAAARVPARKTGKPAAKGKPRVGGPGSVIAGKAMGNAAWTPAGGPVAGAGMPGAGMPGAGLPGAGMPGAGFTGAGTPGTSFTGAGTPGTSFTGAGTPGARMPGGASPGAADGQTAAAPGRATPQIEPVGFVPAPLVPGAEPPTFGASSPGSPDLASESSGGAPEDPGADSPAPANAPPWAPIQTDPSARFRSASSAAIPNSAFPGPADGPEAAPPGDPGGAGADRAGGRRAQGTHRGPLRTPQVSGSPPWGPAPQPDSELPWTQTPTPARADAGLPQRQPTRPEMPTWEVIAEEAWPGGPRGAKPHPPSPSPADPPPGRPSGLSGPAGPVPRPADPQADSQQQTAQPIYPWSPGPTAEPPGAASPKPGPGFLRRGQPADTAQPAGAQPGTGPARSGTGPAGATPSSAATAGTPLSGAGTAGFGPGGFGPTGAASPGTGPSSAGTSRARPTGARPTGARPTGAGTSGAGPSGAGPTGAGPTGAGTSGAGPSGAGPTGAGPTGAGTSGAGPSGTGPTGAGPTGAGTSGAKLRTGVPPWEITDSFLAIRTESPGATRSDGSFPTAPAAPDENTGLPREGSFPARPAEPPRVSGGSDLFSRSTGTPSFPGSGASFPTGTAAPSGFPSGGASFPSPTSGFARDGSSFPGTPSETPSFPPGTGSFPGDPAQPPGLPRATPLGGGTADASGESTENIPAVAPPTAPGKLPRRIPLSERTSGFPPPPQRHDDDAFRLFPFGKTTDTPPSENSED
jgi:Subtilase family